MTNLDRPTGSKLPCKRSTRAPTVSVAYAAPGRMSAERDSGKGTLGVSLPAGQSAATALLAEVPF